MCITEINILVHGILILYYQLCQSFKFPAIDKPQNLQILRMFYQRLFKTQFPIPTVILCLQRPNFSKSPKNPFKAGNFLEQQKLS